MARLGRSPARRAYCHDRPTLPTGPTDPGAVVDELVRFAQPGLMAMPSGKFFGWVIGGTLPGALGADWMVSAWDQNAAMRLATPATAAAEEVAGRWLLELLRLPTASAVGFVTSCQRRSRRRLPTSTAPVFGARPAYLIQDDDAPADPFERVPEFSRRARGVPVWAALRQLGRGGVVGLVEGLAAHARAPTAGIAAFSGTEVLNDVVFTQVSTAFGSDERTKAVTRALIEEGAVWMSGSRWHGREILRISVSNWSTDDGDVAASIAAVARAMQTAD